MSRVNPSNLADLVTFQSVLSSVLITMSRSISGILRDSGQSRPATEGAKAGVRRSSSPKPAHRVSCPGPMVVEDVSNTVCSSMLRSSRTLPGQQQDVAAALVKSWDLDGDDSQAEEQVPAEFALLDHLLQIAVGCADDPQVDLALLDRAHPAYGSVLKQLEQLCLQPQVHLSDLVEEQGAAIGRLSQTDTSLLGVSERALLVPEKLGFQQMHGDRSAVEFNEGSICARPAEVQRPGHQLLAGTRFTLDQHRRQLTVAHAPLRFLQLQDEVLDRSHRRGLADHQLKSALAGFALLIEGQLTFHALRLPTLVE